MPLQKAFTLNGNPIKTTAKEVVFLIIGLIGGFLLLFEFVKLQPAFLLIGRGLLLISAVYFRLTYFIAMQLILLASYGGIYLGIGSTLTLILPILLSFQLLIYYLLSGELKSVFRFIGIAGIAILSIGLTLNIPLILLFGRHLFLLCSLSRSIPGDNLGYTQYFICHRHLYHISYPLMEKHLWQRRHPLWSP